MSLVAYEPILEGVGVRRLGIRVQARWRQADVRENGGRGDQLREELSDGWMKGTVERNVLMVGGRARNERAKRRRRGDGRECL